MIATNKDIRETDKLFKKLIAPGLGTARLDSHLPHHHPHTPVKVGPGLLPQRSGGHGIPQASDASHRGVAQTKSMRAPPSTEITLDESLMRIGGRATTSAVEFDESWAHSCQGASGGNSRRQQQRPGTSLSSVSCTASVPWTFYSTTKMKQLPLPQVQSVEVLRASSPNPRGKRNVSVSSERYLGTTAVGQPQHRRSKSAAEVLHPMSSKASASDQVRRFEEERMALLRTRSLKRSTEVMAHRKDRKYHMCGSGVSIHDRYTVDSQEMDRLRQLIQARSTKRGGSPVSYYDRYGVRVTSGGGTRLTKPSTATQEQKEQQDKTSADVKEREVLQIQNLMPNVRISRKVAKKTRNDAFMTDVKTSDAAGDDLQDMLGNFQPDHPTASNERSPEDADASRRGSPQESRSQETCQDPHRPTAEEALLGMLVSDDKIAAMEDRLRRIERLSGDIQDVGHLEGSELNLEVELNANGPGAEYGWDVFGRVLNNEELKEIERLRAEKREARSAKSRRADDSIMAEAKVSQAKSQMADIYNFISPAQQEVLEKKFRELDVDGNGVVTLQELFKRMYRGKANRELGRAFMQVFDLNKDQTIDEREFVIVAALNDKLTGKLTDSADAPLELDLDRLAQSITAYKQKLVLSDQRKKRGNAETDVSRCRDNSEDVTEGSDQDA